MVATPPIPIFNEALARANLPAMLIDPRLKRWFAYRLTWKMTETGEMKLDKRPSSIKAKYEWDEPDGWVNFDDICKYIRGFDQTYRENPNLNVRFRIWPGFPITEDYHIIFLDLDKCFQADGTLTPTARRYYDALKNDSFVEKSVSGKGLHIFTWYTGNRKFSTKPEPGVEVYLTGRGALITGDAYHE